MELLWAVIVWCLFGLVAGAIARLLVPGRQPIGIAMTILLGIAGSVLGGFIAYLVMGGEPLQASGFIMSIIGAVLLLAIYVGVAGRGRRHTTLKH